MDKSLVQLVMRSGSEEGSTTVSDDASSTTLATDSEDCSQEDENEDLSEESEEAESETAPTEVSSSTNEVAYLSEENEKTKICKFCYSDEDLKGGWVAPCRCSGSMRWVHQRCIRLWFKKTNFISSMNCEVCSYPYQKRWGLVSFEDWKLPQINLSLIDIILIMSDMYYLYKLKQGRFCFTHRPFICRIIRGVYILRRAFFYTGLAVNIGASFFDVTVVNAFIE